MIPDDTERDLSYYASDAFADAQLERHNEREAAKRAKRAKSEGVLQKHIADALVKLGFMVVRINSSTHHTDAGHRLSAYRIVHSNATSGHSDLVAYRQGRAWFVEVKTPTGRISPTQLAFANECTRYGMTYKVLRSVDEAIAWAEKEQEAL